MVIDANAIKWPTKQQEEIDEINDSKIIVAVQRSMREWEKSKLHKRHRKKRADKSVCYGELGCFEDSGPFGYLDMLPSSPEEIDTRFYFYSTKNRTDRPLVDLSYMNMTDVWNQFSENRSIESNANKKIVQSIKSFEGLDKMSVRVIVHGFGSSCSHVWIYEMRTALMAVEDCVVICVDWENGANLPNYVRAAANTRLIGKQLAILIQNLQKYKGLELSRVHIIGFSLGAHVSGFAGAELPGLSRITGLDPAGPLFESQHPKARLDSTDANFIDVIHSNGENLILGGLGSWQPMGDVDFYPNGGRVQHGCSNLFVGAVTDFIWSPAAAVEGRSLCNHRRAYKFFIDSVAPRCLFPSFPCESYDDFLKGHCFPCDKAQEASSESKCGNMGYYADRSTGRGQLYLVTREEEPFCAHQFNIEIHSSENYLPLRTLGKLEAILEGDGSLNETFGITEKDDAEFVAGEVISRILVPHPALGFPHSITLMYKSYSGWLSKGLPSWTIHKIVLTDSFGESKSLCRRDIVLDSEVPVYLELKAGNCYTPDENDITYSPELEKPSRQSISAKYEKDSSNEEKLTKYFEDNADKFREKKDVINLGTNFKITQNNTYSFSEPTDQLPWQPILDGNSLDKNDATETSRMFPVIIEPIVKIRNSGANNQSKETGRSLSPIDEVSSMTEQSVSKTDETTVKATTEQLRHNKTKNAFIPSNEVIRSRENTFFTIQLLPFKLGDLFEKAERYARETLFPLISEQAPRFFGFGAGDPKSDTSPKYFPPLGEISEETNDDAVVSERKLDLPPTLANSTLVELDDEVNKNGAGLSDNEDIADNNNSTQSLELETAETQVGESRSSKNILSLLRADKSRKFIPVTKVAQSAERRSYYTEFSDGNIDEDLRVVHIDLPTYKPPPTISTLFPYKFVKSTEDEIKVVSVENKGT
ncbi:Inactive pancreatic lipase-related protein 1 [Pseudolycoriella hygida]|uniref:Inactive pancreatic lipase-related protein 1 n=1 Tax=Pseudolycoriella hygida TaxID=35572 RepID=A0A9Q0MSP8_9DIPT|nr:Inactive pancreatic lipase-related protein 1 [Pseudolycoriella hygida]